LSVWVACRGWFLIACRGWFGGWLRVSPRHLSERLAEGFAEEFDDRVVFRLRVGFWG
jgi:hypothetical protein